MSGDDVIVMPDGWHVIVGWGYLQCNCRVYLANGNWCEHVEQVLTERLDAKWITDQILSANNLVDLGVPLFTWTDPTGKKKQFIYRQVRIQPKTTPAGLMGQCRFEVPAFPAVGDSGDFPGTIKAGGVSFASAGVITPGEGRRDIATSMSSWVAAQMALLGQGSIECDAFAHQGGAPLSPLDKTCIILTGECIDCYAHKTDPLDDVPDF